MEGKSRDLSYYTFVIKYNIILILNYEVNMKIINGFKIVKDLGRRENSTHCYALVICKACNMKFETSIYTLHKIKSCGCLPISIAKKLPDVINGFKILKDFGYSNSSRRALVICKVCENEYEVDPNKLRYRKHCGCIKHGKRVCIYAKTHPRLMNIYKSMKSRCYNRNNKDFYNYGDRGITVFNEWKQSADKFCEWALSNGYENELSIDRINSNGNYEPNNCRWADDIAQARNTNRNVLTIELANEIRSLKDKFTYTELSKKFNVSKGTIAAVLGNRIWKN